MEVRVLGSIEVQNGVPLAIGGPRQRRIVAALAMNAGSVVSIDRLVDIVWPEEEPPAQAERNVRTYVSRIRHALGDEADRLVTAPPGYVLHLEPDELDASSFEEKAAGGDRLLERGDGDAALSAIDEALTLWRGPPYAEFADEEWVRAECARLAETRTVALELRMAALLHMAREAEALQTLETLIASFPLRERPRRLQMLALYRSGRQAEALRAFQEFREHLIDEIGVAPSDELVQLDRRIAAGDPELSTPSKAKPVRGYEINELIGSGAFAEVYRGTQPALNRAVAIKAIKAQLANRPEFIRGFEAEAQIIAAIEHPHIVPLYDFWREPDRAYLVMRWLTGGTLEASLDAGPWPLERVARLVEQVGAALAAAHRAGVVHRDVKSANILLDDEDNTYLSDFGIASDLDDSANNPQAALSEGSPAYAAPEQLRKERLGPAADIHAFGIVIFEALTGCLPFQESTDKAALLQKQLHEPIPPVTRFRPELPRSVDDVLATATAKDAVQRFSSVTDLMQAFSTALADTPGAPSEVLDVARRVTENAAEVVNPFKGLRAFDEGDAADFRGRERLVEYLLQRMATDGVSGQFLALIGASGSGKSSLVRAGLLPAVRAGGISGSDSWFVTTMSPGSQPYEALETALLRVAVNPPATLLEQLRSDRRGVLRGLRRVLPADDGTVLLVIDQFEELFTLCHDDTTRMRFLEALTTAVREARSPLRLVLTLRADFYDQPLRYEGFAELLRDHGVTITPLAADELERAIVEPAAAVGVEFEPGLVAEIVADVSSQPGALPLMQYALTELFEQRVAAVLTLDSYRDIGGLPGALARKAEELYGDSEHAERDTIRRLFGRLVTLGEGTEDTRRRVRASELGDDANLDRVVRRYGQARLLTFDNDPGTREPTVEVAHEALIREWPRLRHWLDDDRDGLRIHRHLTMAAASWQAAGRDSGELYRGGRLEAVETWAANHDADLNETETAFLAAGIGQRETERRTERTRVRRLRRLLVGVGIFAVLAVAAGVLALQAQSDAEQQAAAAENRRLVSDVAELSRTDRRVALLLAAEAYRRDPSPATLGAVQTALVNAEDFLRFIGGNRSYGAVEWSSTGEILAAHATGVVAIDPATSVERLEIAINAPAHLAVSHDSSEIAVATGTTIRLFDLATGDERDVDLVHGDTVLSMRYAADGRLVSGDFAGDVYIWSSAGVLENWFEAHPERRMDELVPDSETGGNPHQPDSFPIGVTALAIDSESNRVVTGGLAIVRSWDLETRTLQWEHLVTRVSAGKEIPSAVTTVHAGAGGASVATPFKVQVLDVSGTVTAARDVPGAAGGFQTLLTSVALLTSEAALVAGHGGQLHLIPLDQAAPVQTLDSQLTGEPHLATDPGSTAVAIAAEGGIAIISLDGSNLISRTVPAGEASEGTISPDGKLASLNDIGGRETTIWDLSGPVPVDKTPPGGLTGLPVAWVHQPTLIVATDTNVGGVRHLDPISFRPTDLVYDMDGDLISNLGYVSPDGRTIAISECCATAGARAIIHIFDRTTGNRIERLDDLTAYEPASATLGRFIRSFGFSPDGTRLVATTDAGAAVVWDTSTWDVVTEVAGSNQAVQASYSPDGRWLATIASNGNIQLRDPDSAQPDGPPIVGNTDADAGLAQGPYWTDDARYMITVSDALGRIWDVEQRRQVGSVVPNTRPKFPIVSLNGRWLGTFDGGRFVVWDLDIDAWPALACEAAGRNLTRNEWNQFGPNDAEYRPTCDQWPAAD